MQTFSHKLFASHLPAKDYLLQEFANNSADLTGEGFLHGKRNHGTKEQRLWQHHGVKARAEQHGGAHDLKNRLLIPVQLIPATPKPVQDENPWVASSTRHITEFAPQVGEATAAGEGAFLGERSALLEQTPGYGGGDDGETEAGGLSSPGGTWVPPVRVGSSVLIALDGQWIPWQGARPSPALGGAGEAPASEKLLSADSAPARVQQRAQSPGEGRKRSLLSPPSQPTPQRMPRSGHRGWAFPSPSSAACTLSPERPRAPLVATNVCPVLSPEV